MKALARSDLISPRQQTGGLARARHWLAGLKLEALIVLLLLATIAAMRYQHALLDRTVTYSTTNSTSFNPYFYGDQGAGGTSTVTQDPAHPLSWTCDLRPTYQYAFCGYGLLFDIQHNQHGLNLSQFHSVTIDLSYEGQAESLRMDLKNHDDRQGRIAPAAAEKVNSIEFPIRNGRQTVELSFTDFQVASWWIANNHIPPEFSQPQFDNVTALEMQTGNGARPGRHRLQIHSLALHGTLLTAEQYYSLIFAFWVVIIALILVYRRRQARNAQREEIARWRKTLDTIPQMVWSLSAEGEEYHNGQWEDFTGVTMGAGGARHSDLIHPDDRAAVVARWKNCLETGEPFEAEYRMRHGPDDYRYVLSRAFPELDESGAVARWYGTCTDIHDRILAQQELWRSQNFTRQLVEATPDGVLVVDEAGTIVFANAAAAAGLGAADKKALKGQSWIKFVPRSIQRAALEACAAASASGGPQHFTAERPSPDGPRSWWDVIIAPLSATQQTERLLVISRDISHQKIAEEQARWSAKHDSLTQLPNRVVLQHELDLLTAERASDFAVLILDVDEFKKVNDTLGHDAGDALLCALAKRLRSAARPDDLVARLGGDEFAIVLKGVRREAEVLAVADKIFASLREPCVYQGKIIDCHTSIGASLYPRDGDTKAELLKNADVALYAAKSSGRRNLKVFNTSMRSDVEQRHKMISTARRALREDTIIPYYQPKVELVSGKLAGFEALLRWRHPDKGIQTPETIRAAFDDLALAAEISDRMIDRVILDVSDWLSRGLDFDHVAFNAGAAELRAGDFAEKLLERMERAEIPARCLQMEITETVFLGRGAEYVERTLKTLSESGILIALDDFGTGYASLSHLKEFPVDFLKIDRSFVRHLQTNLEDSAIVDAVVGLGKSLKIDVIAEGIETRAQHDTLVALGCRYGQGFLYARPMAAARVARLCIEGGLPTIAAAA